LRSRTPGGGRSGRRGLLALAAVGGALGLTGYAFGPGATPRAAGSAGTGGEPSAQTDASVPAFKVTMIGASPLEAPDETWGIGETDEGGVSSWTVVRYAEGSGWTLGTGLLDAAGQPLSGFRPDAPRRGKESTTSVLAGQMTANGSGVLVGTVPLPPEAGKTASAGVEQVVLVRNPGGAFQQTAAVNEPSSGGKGATPLLDSEETLFGVQRAPLIAPLEETGGGAGALIVPVNEQSTGVEDGVLHWDGSHWTREPIEIPKTSEKEFRVLAIGASSPSNAWLLGQLASSAGYAPGAVALFHRVLGGSQGPIWQPVAPSTAATAKPGEPLSAPVQNAEPVPFTVPGIGEPPTVQTQVLTVTSEGVWIDGERGDASASTTLYFKPETDSESGRVLASWCPAPSGAPACTHELPEPLPTGPSRSVAWANPSTPGGEGMGERVITGFPEGVSLRLEGTEFRRVLALGGSPPPDDVGGTFGAAFSNPREGWLGQSRLPVHLTLHPAPSRLTPWPTAFRHALVAIAPQPGVPVGSLSSEALAVGDQGEVARYEPGKGWMPESLLDPGGRVETPRLRAIAWPTPSRAYAVGDLGQMWLWRSETGLWEQDPATPFNFRGNLLSIAFDPDNPEVGYAVGQGGLLLGYGKTWTQEALPPQAQGATFTSVAFAGSEAIVAYHTLPNPATNHYVGGLLVNNGNGWEVDASAASAMGENVPWAVAGLPDGGAAFTAGEATGSGLGGQVYERSGPGASWQPTPTPLPGGTEPGSLALFREGGELRAIASGSVPNTYALESEPTPPPGFPANLIPPYPLSAEYGAGHIVRQTAGGWSDEEHELNNVQEPPGDYSEYDMVYRPDPISAVLVNPTGSEGWAVGGFVDTADSDGALDTADVERYPADGVTPPGVGVAQVPTNAKDATFAIGGGAQCSAPCADLAGAGIGPDVWLSSALSRAGQIQGVRAFLYTGPRVTSGSTGVVTQAIPYKRELERYAQIMASSPLPKFVAAAPSDLDGASSESTFEQAFSGFPRPFGNGEATAGLAEVNDGRSSEQCTGAPGCQRAYYAFDSEGSGGNVRVIVLDDTGDVGPTQQAWLQVQLTEAAQLKAPQEPEPVIVIGNANLKAQVEAHDADAEAVARILVSADPSGCKETPNCDGASAYFYDATEQNVQETLHMEDGSIPVFGSGTLGYINHVAESSGAFLGASGFMLAEVEAKARNELNNIAPVHVKLIPNIAELALEAENGTLLRRSQVANFSALARRPRAGNRSQNQAIRPDTSPYIPIPANCVGTACASGLFPEYTFSSSNPHIGNFVKPNLASGQQDAVLLEHEEPVADPQSGLFCAYNAGTTIVTISTGGLSASLPVTVQAGSVRRPCGTQPLNTVAAAAQAASPTPPPAPAPAPAAAGPTPTTAPPVLPVPPPPLPLTVVAPSVRAPFFAAPIPALPLAVFVPPPLSPVGRPAPPSGSSPVSSTVPVSETAVEETREEEEAIESASANSAAYRPSEYDPFPEYLLGVALLAAFAGATTLRRSRRGRRELHVAPATISTMRAQRRMAARTRRRR
jgi:hypothetical protein